jgi:ATP-dependent Clp protease ATP-binding subunit ClpA
MTSNLGASLYSTEARSELGDALKAVLKEHFPPEFLNRLDEIVQFNQLGKQDLTKIVDLRLAEIAERIKEKATMKVSDDAKKLLCEKGYDLAYGARPLNRLIEREILNQMARLIIEDEEGVCHFKVDVDGGNIIVSADSNK